MTRLLRNLAPSLPSRVPGHDAAVGEQSHYTDDYVEQRRLHTYDTLLCERVQQVLAVGADMYSIAEQSWQLLRAGLRAGELLLF